MASRLFLPSANTYSQPSNISNLYLKNTLQFFIRTKAQQVPKSNRLPSPRSQQLLVSIISRYSLPQVTREGPSVTFHPPSFDVCVRANWHRGLTSRTDRGGAGSLIYLL